MFMHSLMAAEPFKPITWAVHVMWLITLEPQNNADWLMVPQEHGTTVPDTSLMTAISKAADMEKSQENVTALKVSMKVHP